MSMKALDITELKSDLFSNYELLDTTIRNFIDFVKAENEKLGQQTGEYIDFDNDKFLKTEENYKGEFHLEATRYLNWKDWSESDIGSGKICKKMIDVSTRTWRPIGSRRKVNINLVDWHNIEDFHELLSNKSKRELHERLFFNFYTSDTDDETNEKLFERAVDAFSGHYDLISFLFFLKSRDHYPPVKPKRIDKAFTKLDIHHKTYKRCTWDNYKTYCEIISFLKNELDKHQIKSVSLLDAQSFVWVVWQQRFSDYVNGLSDTPSEPGSVSDFNLELAGHKFDFSGRKTSASQRAARDKDNEIIGNAGEKFVYEHYEKKRLRDAGINHDPVWKSKKEGDGLGYDILSYDEDGNEIYIEVKATFGKAENPIYITANELEFSKRNPDKYRLYRVYNLSKDAKNGDVLIQEGPLTELCKFPHTYYVEFKPRKV